MYNLRPFWTLFWAIPNTIITLSNYANRKGYKKHINKIDLHENGRKVDIYFRQGKPLLKLDILNLSRLNSSQVNDWVESHGSRVVSKYFPINLYNQDYELLLPKQNQQIDN